MDPFMDLAVALVDDNKFLIFQGKNWLLNRKTTDNINNESSFPQRLRFRLFHHSPFLDF